MVLCVCCGSNKRITFRDGVKICSNCRDIINNSIHPYFHSLKDLFDWASINQVEIIESYINKIGSSYIKIALENGLIYYFYNCLGIIKERNIVENTIIKHSCTNWFRTIDHPARRAYGILENENQTCFCSNDCQLSYVHEEKQKTGPCIKCKKIVLKRDAVGYGIDCGCSRKHANTLQENNQKPSKCTVCKRYNIHRTSNGVGIDCGCSRNLAISIKPDNTTSGECAIYHRIVENRTVTALCIDCQTKVNIETNKDKYCKVCNNVTPHNGNICLVCNPESSYRQIPYFVEINLNCDINNSNSNNDDNSDGSNNTIINFKTKYNCYDESHYKICNNNDNSYDDSTFNNSFILFYDRVIEKYVCWKCYKTKFEERMKNENSNNNYNNNHDYHNNEKYYGSYDSAININLEKRIVCKYCGRLLENPLNNNFCNDKCEDVYKNEKRKLFKHNNLRKCKEHPNEELSYKGKCWSCIKDKTINKEITQNINLINFVSQIKKDYPNNNVIVQLTFRTQDSKDWSGGSRQAFEFNLKEKNIKYFVYIKFYIKKKENNKSICNDNCDENGTYIMPLVCGKSGSLLVNESGSDVNFSENVEDGPSRVFLYESNGKYSWYKEKVLIINCGGSKSNALRIKNEIQKKYNLFGS